MLACGAFFGYSVDCNFRSTTSKRFSSMAFACALTRIASVGWVPQISTLIDGTNTPPQPPHLQISYDGDVRSLVVLIVTPF